MLSGDSGRLKVWERAFGHWELFDLNLDRSGFYALPPLAVIPHPMPPASLRYTLSNWWEILVFPFAVQRSTCVPFSLCTVHINIVRGDPGLGEDGERPWMLVSHRYPIMLSLASLRYPPQNTAHSAVGLNFKSI